MFYEDNNREIYSALLALHHTGRPIDIITVKNELAARGKLDAVGGPFRITALSGGVASSAHLEYHALLLREKFARRELIVGLHRRLAAAADETVDLDETLAELHRLDHLEGEASFTDCMRDMDQLMLDTLKTNGCSCGKQSGRRNGNPCRARRPRPPDGRLATG